MKLGDLQYVPEHLVPLAFTVYRVQRAAARPGTVIVGALKLAPAGLLASRFDLAAHAVGYFAEGPETAVYESLARRESLSLSMSTLGARQLLAMQSTRTLRLADLRPHAATWPFLQSLRYPLTQQIAADAVGLGYEGLMYRSAQQYGHDCMALFGPALAALKLVKRLPLVDASGGLHRAAANALLGSQVPLVP
jgi:hypothetical protein